MAGELGIPGTFFLFLEVRPVENEFEFAQGCVFPDGKEVTISAGEVLENLKAGGAQVLDLEAFALLQESDRVLFGKVAIRIEGLSQAQVRNFGGTFRQGELGIACTLMVENEDMHVLTVTEGIKVDGKITFFVRLQIEEADRSMDEEIDRAAGRYLLTGLPVWRGRGSCVGLGGLAGLGTFVILSVPEDLLFRPGIPYGPGIEDDLRALEHIARKFAGITSFEDVAEFIPDLAAADVKVWQVAGGAAEESSPRSAAEEVKEVEVGKKAGGNKVYPGGLIGVSHLDL